MSEAWAAVPGYEGYYEVSDQGRVRGLRRVDSLGRPRRALIFSPVRHPVGGHMRVTLRRDGARRTFSVHRLVMAAFVGPAPEGREVCHNDGDPGHNALDNLRYDTRSENQLDRVRHGTHNHSTKTECISGHPFDAGNTYVTKDGRRQCKTCRRARDRIRKPRKNS